MPFRTKVRLMLLADKCGWYSIRQHMIACGQSATDRAEVLAYLLRYQGEIY